MNDTRKFLTWSFAFLVAMLLIFFLNNVVGLHFIKESIPLTLLATSITFLVFGLIIRKTRMRVHSIRSIIITMVVCVSLSGLLLYILDYGMALSVSFFMVWLIGGILLFSWRNQQNVG
jgi:FtsH-binding integral membrane protein